MDPKPMISFSARPCCNSTFLQALCQVRVRSHQHPQARQTTKAWAEVCWRWQPCRTGVITPFNGAQKYDDFRLRPGAGRQKPSRQRELQQHSARVDFSPSQWRPRPPSAQRQRKLQLITDPPSAPSVWNAKCISTLARNENNCGRQKEIISIAKCYI